MIGATLGPYRVVDKLGEGGMGEVYRAHDPKLGRDVAIKLLPTHLKSDAAAATRFQREARAVAALNHPNIVTIYGVDEADGQSFIAMELVDGTTLRELVPPGGLTLDEVLKHAIPLADALASAHAAGIVHRDLKPANVMVTKEGRVKVLDFGLAKLREDTTPLAETMTGDLTGKGQVVGTVSYMSPEQASGGELDARSDLFSLGVLLYEMSTGQRPFTGKSSVDILAAILKDTPASVTDLRADLPRDFNRIIRRALAKDPEDRYQTAKDLRNDLKTLRQDLTSGELSAAVPASAPGRSGRTFAAIGAVALVVAGAFGYWSWTRTPTAPEALETTIERLTSTGNAHRATLSPDGKYVVHVVSDDQHSLWVRQVSTSSDVQIVPPGPESYLSVAIDPDGDYVYFTRVAGGIRSDLFRVPMLGNAVPQLLVRDVDTAVTFSPDGRRMAYLRGIPSANEWRLIVASVDGSDERIVLTTPDTGRDAIGAHPASGVSLAWSPDGLRLAAIVGFFTQSARLGLVDVETGAREDVTDDAWTAISGLAWLSDRALVVSGTTPSKTNSQLWRVGLDKSIVPITNDLSSYHGVATSTSGDAALITVMADVSSTISVTGPGGSGTLRPVTTGLGRSDGQRGLTWTPDGALIFTATTDGRVDLWTNSLDGTRSRALTSDDSLEALPRIAPGGEDVVYRVDGRGLMRLNLATGRAAPVPSEPQDNLAGLLADGSRLINRGGNLYRVDEAGTSPVLVAANAFGFETSPNGQYVAAGAPGEGLFQIFALPTDGSERGPGFDIVRLPPLLRWTPQSQSLTYLETRFGRDQLWNQPLDGGAPTPVFDPGGDRIVNFAWSEDGRLAIAHGPARTDVVLIRGVR